jgi:hypothetical protein
MANLRIRAAGIRGFVVRHFWVLVHFASWLTSGMLVPWRVQAADCEPLLFSGPEILGRVETEDIREDSGLAASWRNPGVFWTHNDGARENVFALSSEGKLLAEFKITKSVSDTEDLAVGPGPDPAKSYLYIGDIGSNDADRDEVEIFRIPEPPVELAGTTGTTGFEDIEVFHLKYPTGKFDAEALLLDPVARELFIVTKENDGAHIFRAAIDTLVAGRKSSMQEAGRLPFARVSGGAVSRDGTLVALRREDQALLWERQPGERLHRTLDRPATTLPIVGPPEEPNGEAIAFLPDSSGYVTLSEGTEQPLFLFQRVAGENPPEFIGMPRTIPNGVEIQMSACAGRGVSVQRSGDFKTWEVVEVYTSTGDLHTYVEMNLGRAWYYRLVAQ